MAARVTQLWVEVLRTTATTSSFPVNASTTITFSHAPAANNAGVTLVTFTGAASAVVARVGSASTTITFSYSGHENSIVHASAAETITFSDTGSISKVGTASTLLLLSYAATENAAINAAAATTITHFVSCVGAVTHTSSASTTITLTDTPSHNVILEVSATTTITFTGTPAYNVSLGVAGATTITLAGVGSGHLDRNASASTTITFNGFAFGDGFHGLGFGDLLFSDTADCIKIVAASFSTTITLTDSTSGLRSVHESGLTTVTLSGSSSQVHDGLSFCTTQLRMRDTAVPLNKALGGNPMAANRVGYLGRYQLGQVLTLMTWTTGYQGRIVTPLDYPTATIFDDNGDVVGVFSLPALDKGNSVFALPIFLNLKFSVGRFRVITSYSASGAYTGALLDYFEVIPGGDPNGPLISLCSYDRPEAGYVLAQMGSGKLAQGATPQI